MSHAPVVDHLPSGHVQHILLMLGLLVLPHVPHLPIWLSALVLAIGSWRALAAQRAWAMPRPLLRNLIAALVFAGVYLDYGYSLNGHGPGVALLSGMLAMKLTEMARRRDYLLVIYLSYFLLITHFLFSQELIMLPLLFLGALAVTMVLIEVNHPQGPLPLDRLARLAGLLLVQALPLMVVFFLLFPRIPGPLWGLPSGLDEATSGLDDTMSPGGISNLSLSDEVAFRVRFTGPLPAPEHLYWRGPVLENFDGRSWTVDTSMDFPRQVETQWLSEPVDYEIQLEAHGKKWLLALDLPTSPLPANTELGADLVLRHRYDVNAKMLLRLSSVVDFRADRSGLPAYVRYRNLRLPPDINPQARRLASGWRGTDADPRAIIRAALDHFRQQDFAYTLQPPALFRTHLVDEFLFDSRRGFCEHYASAFTFLMRAAGIPARVVTGYQGAEPNSDYFIVRQSDAHAWSEVWLDGRGWTRVDPTAAVAPDRIEFGLGRSLPRGEPVPGLARPGRDLLVQLQLRWDRVNEAWNRWFLDYGPELQRSIMERIGLPGLRAMLLALTFGTLIVLILAGLWTGRQFHSLASRDPVLREWQRWQRKLRRGGFQPAPAEGPRDLLARLGREQPQWQDAAERIARLYIRLRYASRQADPQLLAHLRRRVRRFPRID